MKIISSYLKIQKNNLLHTPSIMKPWIILVPNFYLKKKYRKIHTIHRLYGQQKIRLVADVGTPICNHCTSRWPHYRIYCHPGWQGMP